MTIFNELTATEWNKTFTVQGAIERYKELCRMFANDPTIEISMICEAAVKVMHDKYGVDFDEIERFELEAISA